MANSCAPHSLEARTEAAISLEVEKKSLGMIYGGLLLFSKMKPLIRLAYLRWLCTVLNLDAILLVEAFQT